MALTLSWAGPRRPDAAAVADRAGMSYAEEDPFDFTRPAFALFRQGDGRGAENVMWRVRDDRRPVRAFDYWYYTETKDQYREVRGKSYRWFSCATAMVGGSWPELSVVPAGVLDRVATTLGLPDIQSEGRR